MYIGKMKNFDGSTGKPKTNMRMMHLYLYCSKNPTQIFFSGLKTLSVKMDIQNSTPTFLIGQKEKSRSNHCIRSDGRKYAICYFYYNYKVIR